MAVTETSSLYLGDTKIQLLSMRISSNQYYTSSSTPDNSFGKDGDIYFVKGEE